jgi:methionyl-tRNA formyltransferase
MRIVFMGTPDFAVPSLQLLGSHHEINLVVTQPDRPAGRGRKPLPPPVKVEALGRKLLVVQPETANDPDVLALVEEMRPQVIAVVAYGCILKKRLLQTPTIAPVNLHASLLPRYRGVTPINRAIMEGETITGVTTIHMDEGIDTGDILLQEEVEIGENETAGDLAEKLADVGARLLLKTVDGLEAGGLTAVPQDHSQATYAHKFKKEDGLIPWDSPASNVVNHIRGVTPWPGAVTYLDDLSLTVLQAGLADLPEADAPYSASGESQGSAARPGANPMEDATGRGPGEHPSGGAGPASEPEPGTVISLSSQGPVVAAGHGAVVLRRICPAGKKPMDAAAWARGRREIVGSRFSGRP